MRGPCTLPTMIAVLALAMVPGPLGCTGPDAPRPLMVLTAASTADAMGEIARAYEASTGTPVRVVSAASSTLARQVVAGAPADLLLSADPQWVEWLAQRGHVAAPPTPVATGRLVLFTRAGSPLRWSPGEPLASRLTGRLAVGDPRHVPVGRYARQALETLDQWESMAPRLAPTPDAPAAVALVLRGAASAGIAYLTDVEGRPGLTLVATFPTDLHPPITYLLAPLTPGPAGAHPHAAPFLAYLGGPAAQRAFHSRGFGPASPPTPPVQPPALPVSP